jgi:hypothetical protein
MVSDMRTFKIQSAMEYLMTYGWSILVIAVVLGVLFQLGVFSSSSFSIRAPPGTCQVLRTSAALNLVGQCSGILPQYVAQFNGQNSYVNVGNGPSLTSNSVSVTLWLSPNSLPPGTYGTTVAIVAKGPAYYSTGSWGWFTKVGDRWPVSIGTQTYIYPPIQLPLNSWSFVSFTYDGVNGLKMYLNGQNWVSAAANGIITTTSFDVIFGGSSSSEFSGSMANIQIYNNSLSANDMSDLYNEGIGGAPIKLQNLVGWWPLNGNTKDYSGNGNNGVPTAVSYASQYGK